MTTKKKTTTTKATTKKAAAPKAATTAKKTTKSATAVAEVTTVANVHEVSAAEGGTLTVTIAPEAPETASAPVEAELVVAQAPKAELTVEVKAEAPAAKPVLTIGMLQQRLNELGYYHGWLDGNYGPLTKQAVGHFQWKNGIYADGNATPETLKALGF
jgi:hypothetical protein